jgi:hypothetical protein
MRLHTKIWISDKFTDFCILAANLIAWGLVGALLAARG